MIQTVVTAQELYARAALIDQEKLAALQQSCSLVDAEETFRSAFWTDVRPILREWRESRGLAPDPLAAFRQSGYLDQITKERASAAANAVSSYA